jgi:hypothetical protein
MPAFCTEKAGAVENKNSKHGGNSQPIDVIPPLLHGFVSFNVTFSLSSFAFWVLDDIWTAI